MRASCCPVEAIRLRANRLKVWRKGKLVAETAEVVENLRIEERPFRARFKSTSLASTEVRSASASVFTLICAGRVSRPEAMRLAEQL